MKAGSRWNTSASSSRSTRCCNRSRVCDLRSSGVIAASHPFDPANHAGARGEGPCPCRSGARAPRSPIELGGTLTSRSFSAPERLTDDFLGSPVVSPPDRARPRIDEWLMAVWGVALVVVGLADAVRPRRAWPSRPRPRCWSCAVPPSPASRSSPRPSDDAPDPCRPTPPLRRRSLRIAGRRHALVPDGGATSSPGSSTRSRRPGACARCSSTSIGALLIVGFLGPSVSEPPLSHDGLLPPYFLRVGPSPWLVLGLLLVAVLSGSLMLVVAIRALRRGWDAPVRRIAVMGALGAIVLLLCPPFGSADYTNYSAYGHIQNRGLDAYVVTPTQAASARRPDRVGRREAVAEDAVGVRPRVGAGGAAHRRAGRLVAGRGPRCCCRCCTARRSSPRA